MSIFSFLFKEQTLPDEIKILDREAYKEAISKGKVQLVDVRTKREFASGHIKGAKNIDFFQPSGVSHTNQIGLGKVTVKKGNNTLTITATGTHPDSVKRYMFGLDFLRLAPTN